MVFVDKTLDQMLREAGYSKPKELDEFSHEEIKRNKSYILKIEDPSQDVGSTYTDMCDTLLRWHRIGILADMQAAMSLSGSIGELAGNAIDWGGGLRQINYYFAPKAAVIELLQEKEWDYKKILAKVANGLYPSSRKKSEKILHGGGNGQR